MARCCVAPLVWGPCTRAVSEAIAERWGILDGECQLKGQPVAAPDGLIAATALEHDLILVTRNVGDFAGLGIEVLNPWE